MPERNLPFFEMFAKYHPAPALAAQLETWLVTGAVMDSHSRTIEVKLLCADLPAPALLDQVGAGGVPDLRPAGGDLPPRLPPGSGRGGGTHAPSTGRGGCPCRPQRMPTSPHGGGRAAAWEAPPAPAAVAPAPEEPAGGPAAPEEDLSQQGKTLPPDRSHAAAGHEGRHGRPQGGPGLFLPADLWHPADQKGPQAHEHPRAGHGGGHRRGGRVRGGAPGVEEAQRLGHQL